jgi:hypothetical protein
MPVAYVSQRFASSSLAIILFLACFVGAYVGFSPLYFPIAQDALATSWRAVVGEAAVRGLKFGTDIIYTGGPLSALYGRYFQADRTVLNIVFSATIIVAIALIISVLANEKRRSWWGFTMAAFLLLVGFPRDSVFLIVPVITALIALPEHRSNVRRAAVALGVAATAIVTLAKFSAFPLAVMAFLFVDFARISRRRLPVILLAYLGLTFGLFSFLQESGSFLNFIIYSWSVSAGYTEGMSIPGPVRELVVFIVIAWLFLIAIAHAELRALARSATRWTDAVARVSIIAIYVFVLLKTGFVRHDGHALIAWSGLALGIASFALAAPAFPQLRVRGLHFHFLAWIVLVFYVFWPWQFLDRAAATQVISRRFVAIHHQLKIAGSFLNNPKSQIDNWRRDKEAMWAQIRTADPLPQLEGSVDVIPSIQSSVIAHGLEYRPRFSFQEFVTYSGALIEANRRSLIDRGPKYLLFQPGSIDNRYPALAEGPLWPHIIRLYEPDAQYRQLLVLRRRERPIEAVLLSPSRRLGIKIGESMAVPAGKPLFLKANIRLTALGHLANIVLRPSLFFLEIQFETGEHRRYRLIPAIARAGFFISPFISTADDFLQILSGKTENGSPRITNISLWTSEVGRLLYHSNIEMELSELNGDALRIR